MTDTLCAGRPEWPVFIGLDPAQITTREVMCALYVDEVLECCNESSPMVRGAMYARMLMMCGRCAKQEGTDD